MRVTFLLKDFLHSAPKSELQCMSRVAMLQKIMTLWVVVCISHILTVGFKEIVEVLSAFGSDVCAKMSRKR